jgi:RHS repeat-associated protein
VLGSVKRNGSGTPIDGSGCLYHVRHRVYDPSLGRWLTRDPAGFVDGMNLYEYCAGSAIDAMDPSGLELCPEWHHMLPQGGETEWGRRFVEARGLNIDSAEFGVLFGNHADHMELQIDWNSEWKDWMEKNPTATENDIRTQLRTMRNAEKYQSRLGKAAPTRHSYSQWKNPLTDKVGEFERGRTLLARVGKLLRDSRLGRPLRAAGRLARRGLPALTLVIAVAAVANGKSFGATLIDEFGAGAVDSKDLEQFGRDVHTMTTETYREDRHNAQTRQRNWTRAPGQGPDSRPLDGTDGIAPNDDEPWRRP